MDECDCVGQFNTVTVGSEGPRGFDLFYPKPKAYVKEEEVPGEE